MRRPRCELAGEPPEAVVGADGCADDVQHVLDQRYAVGRYDPADEFGLAEMPELLVSDIDASH